jgi:hypothetical protein
VDITPPSLLACLHIIMTNTHERLGSKKRREEREEKTKKRVRYVDRKRARRGACRFDYMAALLSTQTPSLTDTDTP